MSPSAGIGKPIEAEILIYRIVFLICRQDMETIIMHKRIGPELPARISPATLAGNLLFATNIPVDIDTGEFIGGSIEVQARQTFENLVYFVEQAGGTLADIAQLTVFLADSGDFSGMNKVYNAIFTTPPFPTRATVIARSLIGPPGILIETTACAVISTHADGPGF